MYIQSANNDMSASIMHQAPFSCTFSSSFFSCVSRSAMMLMMLMADDYIDALSMLRFNNIRSILYVCVLLSCLASPIHSLFINPKMIPTMIPFGYLCKLEKEWKKERKNGMGEVVRMTNRSMKKVVQIVHLYSWMECWKHIHTNT